MLMEVKSAREDTYSYRHHTPSSFPQWVMGVFQRSVTYIEFFFRAGGSGHLQHGIYGWKTEFPEFDDT